MARLLKDLWDYIEKHADEAEKQSTYYQHLKTMVQPYFDNDDGEDWTHGTR
jgi:hypothetical protein